MKVSILKKAIEQAENSTQRFGLGAVIFKGSSIFGSGCNDKRSSNIPNQYKRFPHSFHAEVSALQDVQNWDKLKGTSIIVIRLNKAGKICSSFPCKYCIQSLQYVGVKWVYYSNKYGEIKRSRI